MVYPLPFEGNGMLFSRIFTALASVFMLASCGGTNFKPEDITTAALRPALPSPAASDLYVNQRDIRIGPGDTLLIEVFDVPALKRTLVVSGEGNLQYPLVGSVDLRGLTLPEASERLQVLLARDYLRDPQVSITMVEAVSQRFSIYGGVTMPGLYPLVGDAYLTDAISLARGTSENAQKNEVLIFRTVDGEELVARFSLNDIDGARQQNPKIFPRDRIVVGNNGNRELLRDVAATAPVLGIFYTLFQ